MEKKSVVVTGGAGFIGSHLCDHFLRKGYQVFCVDNLLTGSEENIAHLRNEKDFVWTNQDVSKFIHIDDKVDYVLHFASPASPADYMRFPIQTLKVGALGTHSGLGLAKAKGALFLLASTSEVYGDPLVHPQHEDYWGNVNPIGPRGVYDEAKRFAEALTLAYRRTHKMEVRIARIFNTYGPRMRRDDGRAIPNFTTQALLGDPITIYGDGEQTRSFCYIDDLVDGIDRLLFSSYNEPINLGNPVETAIKQLAQLILQISGSQSQIIFQERLPDDPKTRQPDTRRAKQILGWEAKTSLPEGLQKTLAYFEQMLKKRGALKS